MPLVPIILAILIAGGAGTAVLADNAKPGDFLYGLDQAMENMQENWSMSQSNRARFLAGLSEERAQELLALRNVDPTQFTEMAQERWGEHQEDALERLAVSVEKVEAVQVKFQEKLVSAKTDEQEQVFQKIINHLDEVKVRRESRITKIEAKEYPGFQGLMVNTRLRAQENISLEARNQIRSMIQERFNDDTIDSDDDQTPAGTGTSQQTRQGQN